MENLKLHGILKLFLVMYTDIRFETGKFVLFYFGAMDRNIFYEIRMLVIRAIVIEAFCQQKCNNASVRSSDRSDLTDRIIRTIRLLILFLITLITWESHN